MKAIIPLAPHAWRFQPTVGSVSSGYNHPLSEASQLVAMSTSWGNEFHPWILWRGMNSFLLRTPPRCNFSLRCAHAWKYSSFPYPGTALSLTESRANAHCLALLLQRRWPYSSGPAGGWSSPMICQSCCPMQYLGEQLRPLETSGVWTSPAVQATGLQGRATENDSEWPC